MKWMMVFGLFCAAVLMAGSAAAKPNIIVILADDLGYGDLGYTGSTAIPTPNIDRLATNGVECTYGYVTHPYCGPSRAALLSGRYQQRFGFETNPPYAPDNPYSGMPETETLIAKRLKDAGYKTAVVGKWHLGSNAIHHPNNRGFDFFFGFLGGGHDYWNVDTSKPSEEGYLQPLMKNGRAANVSGYLTDQLTDEAISFIESNRADPFFLYMAYNAPHTPLQAPGKTVKKFKHLEGWERQTYAAMVFELDENIGRIVGSLEAMGLAEDTLIFFLSDNGGPKHWEKDQPAFSSNAPFRGYKGDTYDGGVHVPFIVYWPGKLSAGKFEKPVVSLDITRTAAALAGADENGLEGVNLIPFLKGENQTAPHDAIYFRRRNNAAWGVVSGDGYKWLKNDWNTQNELYNLWADVAETNDLINAEPERAKTMADMWNAWNETNVPFSFSDYIEYHRRVQEFYKNLEPK